MNELNHLPSEDPAQGDQGRSENIPQSDLSQETAGKPKKKMKTVWKVLLIVAAVLLGLLLLLGGIVYGVFLRYYSLMDIKPRDPVANYEDIVADLKQGEMPDTSGLSEEEKERLLRAWEAYLAYLEEERQANAERPENPDAPEEKEEELKEWQEQNKGEPIKPEMRDDGLINILLMGRDYREGWQSEGRSDAMIVATINPHAKTIYLTSFLRDSYVYIPGIGWDKLNHAYVFGGGSLVAEAIEQNFGIVIDNYIAVDFTMFKEIVELAGGIDIALSKAEFEYLHTLYGDRVVKKSGKVHMDGEIALEYSRLREIDSDDARSSRQRKVISALVEKGKKMEVSKLLELMEIILPGVTTDLSQGDCLSLFYKVLECRSYPIVSQQIPVPGKYKGMTLNGVFYWKVDLEGSRKAWLETAGQGTKQ